MKNYNVKFAYSGCGKTEFFTVEFIAPKDINKSIAEYVKTQNSGESKSDRIRYHSKEVITT